MPSLSSCVMPLDDPSAVGGSDWVVDEEERGDSAVKSHAAESPAGLDALPVTCLGSYAHLSSRAHAGGGLRRTQRVGVHAEASRGTGVGQSRLKTIRTHPATVRALSHCVRRRRSRRCRAADRCPGIPRGLAVTRGVGTTPPTRGGELDAHRGPVRPRRDSGAG